MASRGSKREAIFCSRRCAPMWRRWAESFVSLRSFRTDGRSPSPASVSLARQKSRSGADARAQTRAHLTNAVRPFDPLVLAGRRDSAPMTFERVTYYGLFGDR